MDFEQKMHSLRQGRAASWDLLALRYKEGQESVVLGRYVCSTLDVVVKLLANDRGQGEVAVTTPLVKHRRVDAAARCLNGCGYYVASEFEQFSRGGAEAACTNSLGMLPLLLPD